MADDNRPIPTDGLLAYGAASVLQVIESATPFGRVIQAEVLAAEHLAREAQEIATLKRTIWTGQQAAEKLRRRALATRENPLGYTPEELANARDFMGVTSDKPGGSSEWAKSEPTSNELGKL